MFVAVGAALLSWVPAEPAKPTSYKDLNITPKQFAHLIRDYKCEKKVTKTPSGTTHAITEWPRIERRYPRGIPRGPLHRQRIEQAEYHDHGSDGWGPGDYTFVVNNDRALKEQFYITREWKQKSTGYLEFKGPGSNHRLGWRTRVDGQGQTHHEVIEVGGEYSPKKLTVSRDRHNGPTWFPVTNDGKYKTDDMINDRGLAWEYITGEPKIKKIQEDAAAEAKKEAAAQE
ncbi:hypothetical protein CMO91_02895 [Candidatus Woesearchaeota archaeon]|nr:hypothetical protein [Candidatus Woesearchaeota archaeon]